MKLLRTKRVMTLKGETNELSINKDEFVLGREKKAEKYVIFANGIEGEKALSSFEELTDLPTWFERFGHKKIQTLAPFVLKAAELGFRFEEEIFGEPSSTMDNKSTISTSAINKLFENTKKAIMCMNWHWIKDINGEEEFKDSEDRTIFKVTKDMQAVFIDFTSKELMNPTSVSLFMEKIATLQELTEAEKKAKEYKIIAQAWGKEMTAAKEKAVNDLKKFEEDIKRYELEYTQSLANRRNANIEIERIKEMEKADGSVIVEELDKVTSLEFVDKTWYEKSSFFVRFKDFVTPLTCEGNTFPFPFKEATVELTPKEVKITHAEPVDVNGTEWYHPHIEGGPNTGYRNCFGHHNLKLKNL